MRLSARSNAIKPSATVSISDRATQLRASGVDVIDLAAGRASEHTPRRTIDAAISALQQNDVHQTMALGTDDFRQAAATKLLRDNGIVADPETNIIASFGAKNGLVLSLLTLLDPGDEVLIEDPGFVSYQPTLHYLGAAARPIALRAENRFRWDPDELRASIGKRTRAILVCSPQNPTGTVHSREDLEAIAAVAREHDLWVIVDLPYERVVWGSHTHHCIGTLDGMAERTVHLFSLTKSHAMGGWRCGFVHAAAPIIAAMTTAQGHLATCVSSFVQAGAATALRYEPEPEVLASWSDWESRVAFVVEQLDQIDGLHCEMPEGGFYAWVNIRELGYSSEELAHELCERAHVTTVPGSAFGPTGEGYLRVTCVKSWKQVRAAIDRMKPVLRHKSRSRF